MKTGAQRALYNNLGKDEALTLAVDKAIQTSLQNGWKDSPMKTKRVRLAIRQVLSNGLAKPVPTNTAGSDATTDEYRLEALTAQVLELAKHQNDY